jgi:hypothetical protein
VIRFEDDTLGAFTLDQSNGVRVESFDAALPSARTNTADRPNANGVDDLTRGYGARSVSMTLHVFAVDGSTRQEILDRLAAYCSPARRPFLYVDLEDSGDERRLRCRGTDLGHPITLPGYAAVQLALTAPDGYYEAAQTTTVEVPAALPAEGGRTYPRTYPLTYRQIPLVGSVDAHNDGTEPTPPLYRLWGPCTDPALVNVDTGERITFAGLTLTDAQYAEVDPVAYTATLNGRSTDSLYGHVDLLNTDWGYLAPGANRIRYAPATYSGNARAELVYRSAWL